MRRVVITGVGIISAAGENKEEFYTNLIEGKPFIDKVENFDVSLFHSRIASQDLKFDPLVYGIKDHKRMDRYVQFSLAAAKQAVDDKFVEQTGNDQGLALEHGTVTALGDIAGGRALDETTYVLETGALDELSLDGAGT